MPYGVIPSIRVRDVPRALDFYTNVLGFELLRGGPDEANNSLKRHDSQVMIEGASAFYSEGYNAAIEGRMGGASPMALYMEAPDLDELHARVGAAGATIVDPLAVRDWGQTEFTVQDPEGNWLTFWKAT